MGWPAKLGAASAICAMVATLTAWAVAPTAIAQSSASQQDIAVRDTLIANQEALLNTYRCLFHIDTDIVPGGCLSLFHNQYSQVSAGLYHRCAVLIDQTGRCWGKNDKGQANAPGGHFTAISTGLDHSCGIRTDQTAACWGNNDKGQTDAPGGHFTAISTGLNHSCGIRTDQTAACWGNNASGQASPPDDQFARIASGPNHSCGLGVNHDLICWGDDALAQGLAPKAEFLSVSASMNGVSWCGVRVDRTLACWGYSSEGQLDPPAGEFSQVSSGWTHTCGLRADQAIICWGGNDKGQADAPAGQFTAVSTGLDYSCGIRTDQSIICWGSVTYPFAGIVDVHVFYCASNSRGYTNEDLQAEVDILNDKVGSFYAEQSSNLVRVNFIASGVVLPGTDWRTVRTGDQWAGEGYEEEELCKAEILERGDFFQWIVLVDIRPGTESPADDAAAFSYHGTTFVPTPEEHSGCGDLSVHFRIRNYNGNECLAHSFAYYMLSVAREISSSVISLGHSLDCSITGMAICGTDLSSGADALRGSYVGCADLQALGWPNAFRCVLAHNGAPLGQYSSLSARFRHSCGLRDNGAAECWGNNQHGQSDPPQGTFTAIFAGLDRTCAFHDNGAIECWGNRHHRLGDRPGIQFIDLSLGIWHTCGLRDDGIIKCWGDNSWGQSHPPSTRSIAVSVGSRHSCAIREDKTVTCWGDNQHGQLDPPQGTFTAISAGSDHTCAIREDKTAACWGSNADRRSEPPPGHFTAISAGEWYSCGIRIDGAAECWGLSNYRPATALGSN